MKTGFFLRIDSRESRCESPVLGTLHRSFGPNNKSNLGIVTSSNGHVVVRRKHFKMTSSKNSRGINGVIHKSCMVLRKRQNPGRSYIRPPPLPHFWAEGIFEGEGGGGIFRTPPGQELYTPPLFYTPPTPRSVFLGVGGQCIKFGPPQKTRKMRVQEVSRDRSQILRHRSTAKRSVSGAFPVSRGGRKY